MALPEGSYTQYAYVVRDIQAQAKWWTTTTGAGPWFIGDPPIADTIYRGTSVEVPYRLAMGFLGPAMIELVLPLDDAPSIFAEGLRERGEGYHHISPAMSSLSGPAFDARVRELESTGLQVVMTNAVAGFGRAAYFDATRQTGGFIEVIELGEAYPYIGKMADAHADWDGSDPVRTFDSLFG